MDKLDLLIHRIINKPTVSKEDVLDDIKQYWNDAVDTVSSYWNDTDEEIAEELGVTPTAIQELLEPHRSTFSYANLGGNSSIRGYDHGDEWMLVLFSDGNRYLYTVKSTTPESIGEMKRLASIGKGLNSYIMRLQRMNYAGRNVKGEILIKPGMESYNPEGFKRVQLLIAFRNTVPPMVSNETLQEKTKMSKVTQDTLNRYKEQIVAAGKDGLDTTARKIMAVGLNKTAKVALEDFGDTGQAPDQQTLTDAIDSELGEGDLQYSFEGIWQSIKDFFAMRPKSIHLSGRDHDLPNKLARTINDATWLSRQKYTLGEVNYRAIPDFNTSTATRYVQQYVSAVESASQVNAREMSKISERLRVVQAVYRQYAQREILDTTPIDLAIRDINPYNIRLNIQIREPVIEFGPKERQEGPALTKAEVKQFAGLVNTVFNAQRGYTSSLSINTANPWKHNVDFRYRHKPGGDQVLAKLAQLDKAYNQLVLMIDRELKQQITTHTAWIAAENLADSLVNYISKSITNVSSNEDYVGKFEPSNEGFIDGLRKFFSPSKDQDIYATVNKGFLYNLTAELKKYTNIQWVKDRKPVEGKKIEIDGANLIGEYDKVVSDFTQQCLQLRTKHAEVAETAFNNMEEVIQQIGKGNIKSSDDINKLITIMKATRQLKAPKPEVPKATPKKGEVKVLTPEEIVDKATKLLKLFETLGADTKYVDRWDKNFINSHAWMDWKFMGKEGERIQTLVKDNKFGELYERSMEHVYDMRRIGSEFHHLKPWIMAEFQLIEKSVGD